MISLQCKFHALNARYYKYILPLKDFKSFLANCLIKKGLTKKILTAIKNSGFSGWCIKIFY